MGILVPRVHARSPRDFLRRVKELSVFDLTISSLLCRMTSSELRSVGGAPKPRRELFLRLTRWTNHSHNYVHLDYLGDETGSDEKRPNAVASLILIPKFVIARWAGVEAGRSRCLQWTARVVMPMRYAGFWRVKRTDRPADVNQSATRLGTCH